MPKPEKVQQLEQLKAELQEAGNFFLIEFSGVPAPEFNRLRAQIREAGGRLKVTKNTFLVKAFKALEIEGLDQALVGPTAVVLCGEDPVAPAKAVLDFADEVGGVRLKAAYVEGQAYDAAGAESIAKLPSKMELQAQALAAINGPLAEFVGILSNVINELVWLIDAKVKEDGGGEG